MENGRRINPNVIVIVGPTCSGKTNLSLKLAKRIPSEIISADSRQIYKYLDIGTAKPSKQQREQVTHYLINVLDPSKSYDASLFEKDAERIIDQIQEKNKTPIVVGGSGLYIKSLIDGIFDTAETDEKYRKELKIKRTILGNRYIYEELKKIDPESAAKLLPQNWKRVMRALEVYHSTGEPIWKHHQKQSYQKEKKYSFKQFGLNWERKILYENIDNRVDEMIQNGFVQEVENILTKGYDKNLNSLNTVGYKEIIEYFEGEISFDRSVELIKRNTRHYAKRQMTWFRKDNRIQWFDINDLSELDQIAEKIIQSLN